MQGQIELLWLLLGMTFTLNFSGSFSQAEPSAMYLTTNNDGAGKGGRNFLMLPYLIRTSFPREWARYDGVFSLESKMCIDQVA